MWAASARSSGAATTATPAATASAPTSTTTRRPRVAVRRGDHAGDDEEPGEPAGMRRIAYPPEHDEVPEHDPRMRPPDRVLRPAARERREREDAVEEDEDAVERAPPRDVPAAEPGHGGQRAEHRDPDLHPRRGERNGDDGQREQRVRHTADTRRRAAHTPRRVMMTFTVSDRILRSSQSERLWM